MNTWSPYIPWIYRTGSKLQVSKRYVSKMDNVRPRGTGLTMSFKETAVQLYEEKT